MFTIKKLMSLFLCLVGLGVFDSYIKSMSIEEVHWKKSQRSELQVQKSPFQLPVYSESYDSHNVSMPEETTQSTALVSKPTIDAQHQFDMHQSNVEQVNNVFVPHVERSLTDIWKEKSGSSKAKSIRSRASCTRSRYS